MSKISKQVDQQSDSDLSLQLSDASSLTSDSDLSDTQQQPTKKKTVTKKKKKTVKKPTKKSLKNSKKKIKDDSQYCTCRRGYDGKEFMIECDGCQEWFHGACVGLKPNSVADHYFCNSCLKAKKKPAQSAGKTLIPPPAKKKSIIILPISKPEPKPTPQPTLPIIPIVSKLSIQDDDEDEDLDDICPVCDGDCTCGTSNTIEAIPPPPAPPIISEPPKKIEVPKIVIKKTIPAASKSKKSKIPKKSISDSSSGSSSSGSSESSDNSSEDSSDEEDTVVERVGLNVKKRPIPKKKAAPTAVVRRGKSTTLLANIVRQKVPSHPISNKGKGKGGKKMSLVTSSKLSSEEEKDSDEEVVVDDLDDLLETMSPLSEHSSNESDNSLLESEEFFTDDDNDDDEDNDINIDNSSLIHSPYPESRTSYSSVHIDSGDDEDIEDTETKAIIADMTLDSDEEEDNDSDLDDGIFVEDDEDDDDELEGNGLSINYYSGNNNWSSDEEDEEEEEFDYTTALPSEDDINQADIDDSDEERPSNSILPLLDNEGNLYDSIAVAFMNALAPVSSDNNENTKGTETPLLGGDYQLSAFELAHALSALSNDHSRQELSRRPSLPSSAVSAAQRHRGSQDFSTSEALRALSALVSDDLVLSLDPIPENEDMSDSQQELETKKETPTSSDSSPLHNLTIHTDLTANTPTTTTTTTTSISTTPTNTTILPNQLALSLSTDLKLQEQILDILKGSTNIDTTTSTEKLTNNNNNNNTTASTHTDNLSKKSLLTNMYPSRQILPKPSGSSIGSSTSTFLPGLEQQIQDAIQLSLDNSKRKNGMLNEEHNTKKRRISRSNSLGTSNNHNLPPMETTSFSTPASPAAIIDELEDMNIQIDDDDDEEREEEEAMAVSMDDLVDTSQLYTRSVSRSPSPEMEDNPYSRDLSRWQRIPIGAFRLMRSKNKLWLER